MPEQAIEGMLVLDGPGSNKVMTEKGLVNAMKLLNRMAGIVVVCTAFIAATANAQEPTAGVVRISDQDAVGSQMQLQSYAVHSEIGCDTNGSDTCESCDSCESCNGHCGHRGLFHDLFCMHRYRGDCPRCQHQHYNANCPHCKNGNCPYHHGKKGKAQNRYGYFRPANLAPFGCYTIAYPINPGYTDQRDGGLYSAQGYGVNVSVPLAPNVGATYNYGWGVPSSRLTPVSNPLPAPMMPEVVRYPQTRVMPVR